MTKSLYATFDGHVFTPEEDIDLLPNKRYLISIETQPSQKLNKNRCPSDMELHSYCQSSTIACNARPVCRQGLQVA